MTKRTQSSISTGPRSNRGKARASKNALKHGLTATTAILEHESQEDLDALRAGLRASLCPIGHLKELLAERVVQHAWRLRRFGRVERDTLLDEMEDGPLDSFLDFRQHTADAKVGRGLGRSVALEKLSRYETGAERALFRSLKELWALQARRSRTTEEVH